MTAFRSFLLLILLTIVAYTLVVISNHGLGLFQVFFGDIASMGWPGQFNLDFLGFLLLSGLWLAWRHQFSGPGLALGVLGVLGGMPLLSSYLLWASFAAKGDIRVIMLGPGRVKGPAPG